MTEQHQPQQAAAKEGAGLEQAATPADEKTGAIGTALASEAASQSEASESTAASEQSESQQSESAEDATPSADDKKADGTKADGTKADGTKADGTKADGTKADGTKADGTKADDKASAGDAEEAAGAAVATKTLSAKTPKGKSGKAAAAKADKVADDADAPKKSNLGLLVAGAAAVVVVVLAVLAAFVWPGFLAGPGKPDGKASAVVTALSSKNPTEVDKVSCHAHDGKSVTHIPPQALQMISAVKQSGPATLSLDTEALAPMDLTLSQQGKTQNVKVDAVLGVTNGGWCLKGLSQREQ